MVSSSEVVTFDLSHIQPFRITRNPSPGGVFHPRDLHLEYFDTATGEMTPVKGIKKMLLKVDNEGSLQLQLSVNPTFYNGPKGQASSPITGSPKV